MEKSKTCYIIARHIKSLEKQDDAIIDKIGELNKKLQEEIDEDVRKSLVYEVAFAQGASMAFGRISRSLDTLLKEIERD